MHPYRNYKHTLKNTQNAHKMHNVCFLSVFQCIVLVLCHTFLIAESQQWLFCLIKNRPHVWPNNDKSAAHFLSLLCYIFVCPSGGTHEIIYRCPCPEQDRQAEAGVKLRIRSKTHLCSECTHQCSSSEKELGFFLLASVGDGLNNGFSMDVSDECSQPVHECQLCISVISSARIQISNTVSVVVTATHDIRTGDR